MSYREFTLEKVKQDLGVEIREQSHLFEPITPIVPSQLLLQILQETVELAIAINTEKARSEMIITPILLELRRQSLVPISLFSGCEFNVNQAKGLTGYCDYIVSRSKQQLTIDAPIVLVTEAKNENIKGGIGQCLASLVAAQLFNQDKHQSIPSILGAVTTGEIWKFMKLEESIVSIDLTDYYVAPPTDRILGILVNVKIRWGSSQSCLQGNCPL